MRYSKQRELVLQKVEQLCDHPTAEEIYDEAIKECPGLSLGYRKREERGSVLARRSQNMAVPKLRSCRDRNKSSRNLSRLRKNKSILRDKSGKLLKKSSDTV